MSIPRPTLLVKSEGKSFAPSVSAKKSSLSLTEVVQWQDAMIQQAKGVG
jgi:hypothetical protein